MRDSLAKIIKGDLSVDDRGIVAFCNDFDFKDVKRFYMVQNHTKGFVRAWHGHEKEGKYVFVTRGAIKIAIVSMVSEDTEVYVLSALKPSILWIPPKHYNGFKTLTENTQVIFYSTSTLEESKADDIRMPVDTWNLLEVEER